MKAKIALIAALFCMCFLSAREVSVGYRITDVTYDITGSTREYALKLAVHVDKKSVFPTIELMDAYIADLGVRLANIRIFEETKVSATYGTPDESGIIPVHVTMKTVDTVNIILLPKPSFDSNTGFLMKLKLKNYNFFGSMREFDADISYEYDENKRQVFEGSFSFAIPFMAMGYEMVWDITSTLKIPVGEDPEYKLSTGIDITYPLPFADMHFGVVQSLSINARDSDKQLYEDDRLFFTEKVYANLPIELYKHRYFGEVYWTPEVSVSANWSPEGITANDLKGPDLVIGHSLSMGRVDWVENFRQGATIRISNKYSHDFTVESDSYANISGTVQAYYSFFDRVGIASQAHAFYNFSDYISEDVGNRLRGILDKRVNTDTAIFFNLDIPIRVIRANFQDISGIDWTKYISFEMQFSPFFDMALTHDLASGTTYSFKDGWYSTGLEVIVYPLKMRSIFVRASVGFDLVELIENGKLSGSAERDGKSVREIFVGLGLQY